MCRDDQAWTDIFADKGPHPTIDPNAVVVFRSQYDATEGDEDARVLAGLGAAQLWMAPRAQAIERWSIAARLRGTLADPNAQLSDERRQVYEEIVHDLGDYRYPGETP